MEERIPNMIEKQFRILIPERVVNEEGVEEKEGSWRKQLVTG